MKVILLADVKGTGKKGQIVETSDGHARNFLIPRKLATEATENALFSLKKQAQNEQHKKRKEQDEAQDLADRLKKTPIRIKAKVGESGKMFGSVTNKEISAALESQTGVAIDRKKIILNEPIKTIGTKELSIKLHANVNAVLTIEVTPE